MKKTIIAVILTAAIAISTIAGLVSCGPKTENTDTVTETDIIVTDTDTDTETEPATDTQTTTDTDSDTVSDTDPSASDSESSLTPSETDTETDTDRDSETEPATETETVSETDAVTEIETETERETETETETSTSTEFSHSHTFSAWKTVKEATCTSKGSKERVCSGCGEKETEEVAATGHEYGEWKTVKEASCKEEGKRERECGRCGKKETEKISLKSHNFSISKTIQPTCTEYGYTINTCSVCGYEEQVNRTDPLGHKYGEWQVVKEATETENGEKKRECERCKKEERASIDKTGKTWDYYVRQGRDTEDGPYGYVLCYDTTDMYGTERTIICRVVDYRTSWGEPVELIRIGKNVGLARWKNKNGVVVEKVLDNEEHPGIKLHLYEDGTTKTTWLESVSEG